MSVELLDRLESGFENIIAALDGQDADAILAAAEALRPMIKDVQTQGVWRDDDALRARLGSLSKHIDAARFRVNKLTHLNNQRVINLSQAMGGAIAPTYGKPRQQP